MANFNYILSITGDCSGLGTGVVNVEPFGGTPPYTVEWVSPAFPPINTIFQGQSSARGGLYSGLYQIRLNDSSSPVNFSFDVNAIVSSGVCVSILNVNASTCGNNNGSVTASATTYLSSVNFEIFTSGGTLLNSYSTDTAQVQFTDLSAGTYYIVATDIGGCSAKTSDFIILNSNALDFGFYIVPNSACQPTNTPIGKLYVTGQTGTPPYTYLWSNNLTGSSITGLTEGFYSVTVTDANGCTKTENAEVKVVDPLGLVNFQAVTPTCFDANGSLEITISGGTAPYYYSASTGDVAISYAQNFTISNVPAGTYQFIVTDAGLCQIIVGSNLQTPNSIGSISVSAKNSTCSSTNGSISINVAQGSGPFTYTLVYPDSSNESTTISTPNYIFDNLYSGAYTVFVSDQSSCVFSQSVNIFTSNLFKIYPSVTGSTCGLNNGIIYVEKSTGGTEPYTYSIDNVDVLPNTSLTSYTFNNLASGSHVISITDASGCKQNKTVYVGLSPIINFTLFPTDCGEGSEGTITAFISSGVPPFTFDWSNNVAGNPQQITVSNLTGGTYGLTITDSNGCTLNRTTTVSCTAKQSGYVPFVVGSEELVVSVNSELGILEMLNDGYQDLTNGNTNCVLNSTTFLATVNVTPVGLYLQDIFYTGSTLLDVPPANLWFNSIENLLLTVPGIDSVNIDPLTNQISITKSSTNPYLDGQVINIAIAIEYDIDC
jgi:hypothetical protein